MANLDPNPRRRLPKDDEVDFGGDDVFDMANLSEARTGVPGFIWISTRFPRHGPRVKYFEKLGPDQPSFTVSIAEEPEVVANGLPKRVLNRMSPPVIEWVRRNHAALRAFWDDGAYWTDDRVTEFKNALVRVD